MNCIQILDCTLRDGGYCNQWKFGKENINKIIMNLMESGIDIIECGYLSNLSEYNPDTTQYTTIKEIEQILPKENKGNNQCFVAMVNYGEYLAEELPVYCNGLVEGLRIAFHKKDMKDAMKLCDEIRKKGYKVFVQPMVSISYSDEEFLELIHLVNEINPYAFYIVDSFGMMKGNDMSRLFYLVEHNLKKDVWMGFHSHNNMQLAYSNAQTLTNFHTMRNIIIDTSVYGMGRGAGNLNTELFVEYLNSCQDTNYTLKPLLHIIDEILNDFQQRYTWGYSLPNYLSAINNIHPNYAKYFDEKKSLTVENMNEVFQLIKVEKRFEFDKNYAEEVYMQFMSQRQNAEDYLKLLKNQFKSKEVLLIAPGKSSFVEKDYIRKFTNENNVISVSINFEYPHVNVGYIFISNNRRYREISFKKEKKYIVTSNIKTKKIVMKIDYSRFLSNIESVRDNAGLMAIKLLILCEVECIYLAGFDGYTHEELLNYGDEKLAFNTSTSVLDEMNRGIKKVLNEYSQKIKIKFLTSSQYQ